ncbi:hypothetical protein JYU34_015692 [Plutella xylostella]|uniref:Uncharacterized protein n=1 Tax=Plutella xylostella TaxID=51655 RepID=A0ABQ7PQ79_PLUXY|nr:hypothetical protein JYU34_022092 [Plutella xylostella]KAG7300143.1 hypothetical protein JYU34_015692 [Plutella xylostella]
MMALLRSCSQDARVLGRDMWILGRHVASRAPLTSRLPEKGHARARCVGVTCA